VNPALRSLLAIALVGLGLLAAILTIGAFGQVNPNVPGPAVLLKNIESLFSNTLRFLPGNEERQAFARGFSYLGFTLVFTALAALLIASPRSEQLTFPGRRNRGASGERVKEA
jgi:hypothetical protein